MSINSVTSLQYSGLLQSYVRKMLEQGKVNPESEEIRVQRVLEEERKRIQPIAYAKGKRINILI